MYVTLKLDDNGCCMIHSVSDDGNQWIVTNERYVVMPWKMVTRHGITHSIDNLLSLFTLNWEPVFHHYLLMM